MEVSVIDGVIVGTDSQSTKGKTDAAGRFVTHWRSNAGKASFSYGVLVQVRVPGWEKPVFCSDSPFLDYR